MVLYNAIIKRICDNKLQSTRLVLCVFDVEDNLAGLAELAVTVCLS